MFFVLKRKQRKPLKNCKTKAKRHRKKIFMPEMLDSRDADERKHPPMNSLIF
jgi:hypothetical protein